MRARLLRLVTAVLGVALLVGLAPQPVQAKTGQPVTRSGVLSDGSAYAIAVPAAFNGTLLLYSHGLVFPGDAETALLAPDPTTQQALLERGYALAGSAFGTGYAVERALRDQVELLDVFAYAIGKPKRTLAWGSSMGGMITAELLERHPERFAGALPTCGLVAGSNGLWDTYLDTMFAIRTLLAPSITLTGDHDPFATVGAVTKALETAQATPAGRARIALAVSFSDMPGWKGAGSPRPDPADVEAQERAQFETLNEILVLLAVAERAEMEQRAGGNPSTNVHVDYARQLRHSTVRKEVKALYAKAGADLRADLAVLDRAPRVSADAEARKYLKRFASFTGELHGRPVLTLHNTGDGLAAPESEQSYRTKVRRAGDKRLLRQLFVERAGHCTFTPAELVASVQVLDQRVRSGHYPATNPAAMTKRAAALGPALNGVTDDDSGDFIPVPPGFDHYRPGRFLRP